MGQASIWQENDESRPFSFSALARWISAHWTLRVYASNEVSGAGWNTAVTSGTCRNKVFLKFVVFTWTDPVQALVPATVQLRNAF